MSTFLGKFFPSVAEAQNGLKGEQHSAYCTFDDAKLQLWTSSMFIAGALTGMPTINYSVALGNHASNMYCQNPFPSDCCCWRCHEQRRLLPPNALSRDGAVRRGAAHAERVPCDAALGVSVFQRAYQRIGRKGSNILGAACFVVGAALQVTSGCSAQTAHGLHLCCTRRPSV